MKNPVFRHHPDRFWCSISLLFYDFFFFFWGPEGWMGRHRPGPTSWFWWIHLLQWQVGGKLNVSGTGPGRTYCNLNKKKLMGFQAGQRNVRYFAMSFYSGKCSQPTSSGFALQNNNNKPQLDFECMEKKNIPRINSGNPRDPKKRKKKKKHSEQNHGIRNP